MNKKNKIFVLAFFLLISFYLLLFVSVPIILAQTAPASSSGSGSSIILNLQQPFGSLAKSLNINSDSIGEYIRALYVFASSVVIIVAIIAVMAGGIQWITSAGNPQKIGQAKDTILKAALGLFIAIFAVFLLETVSPGTVNFNPIDVSVIQAKICCEINGIKQYMTTQECSSSKGTETTGCLDSPVAVSPSTSTCADYSSCPQCTADTKCEWKAQATPAPACDAPQNGQCLAKSTSPISPQSKTLQCVSNTSPTACQANALLNCVWAENFCSLKRGLTSPPNIDPCKAVLTQSECQANAYCQWYDPGCTDQGTLAEQLNNLSCDKRTSANCTTYKCYWQSLGCSGTYCCRSIVAFGQECQFDEDCGASIGFCNKGAATDPVNPSGKCEALRTLDAGCANVCGWPGSCDAACKSKHCSILQGFICAYSSN